MKPRGARRRITLAAGGLAVLAAVVSLRAGGPSLGAEPVVPRETKVLLLPPVDATVDAARLQPLRQQIVRLRQQQEFITRQFAVLGETMAARAATAAPALSLDHESARTAGALDEMARRTGADWVVSIVVREIAADETDSLDGAHSTLLVRIRDARRHAWRLDRTHVGRMKGTASPPEMFIASLDTATREALAIVLAGYPEVVPLSRDGVIVDYLAGQTAPFVGEAGRLFSGLPTAPEAAP